MNEFSRQIILSIDNSHASKDYHYKNAEILQFNDFKMCQTLHILYHTRARLNGICVSGLGKVTAVLAE